MRNYRVVIRLIPPPPVLIEGCVTAKSKYEAAAKFMLTQPPHIRDHPEKWFTPKVEWV